MNSLSTDDEFPIVCLNIAFTVGNINPDSELFNALMPHVSMQSILIDKQEIIDFQIVVFDHRVPSKNVQDYFSGENPVIYKGSGIYEIEMAEQIVITSDKVMSMVIIEGRFTPMLTDQSMILELQFTHKNLKSSTKTQEASDPGIGDSITRRGTVSITKRVAAPSKTTS